MDYTLIVKDSGSLFDRYEDLFLMELALPVPILVEYYEMDFKNVEISEMILGRRNKAYCKYFVGDNAIVAQIHIRAIIAGRMGAIPIWGRH